MKGLDTSALLALLEGGPAARKELRKLRGEELATTEGNLLELAYLAARSSARAQKARLVVLGRLRRRLAVLPLDRRAIEEASQKLGRETLASSPLLLAILGAFESAGCEELLTSEPSEIRGRWTFKVRKFPSQQH